MLKVFALTLAAMFGAASSSLTIKVPGGINEIRYDPDIVSEEKARTWVQLSPHVAHSNFYLVPENLELCIANQPEYKECGTRDIRSETFLHNASVNLRKIRERIADLDPSKYPIELQPVVSYLKEIQTYTLNREEHRLKFYETWNIEHLSAPVRDIDTTSLCWSAISGIRNADTKPQMYTLAAYQWSNCVNKAIRAKLGDYPTTAWENALAQYSITERYTETDVE